MTSSRKMNQGGYSTVNFEREHATSKLPHIRNPKKFMLRRNRNFHNQLSVRRRKVAEGTRYEITASVRGMQVWETATYFN